MTNIHSLLCNTEDFTLEELQRRNSLSKYDWLQVCKFLLIDNAESLFRSNLEALGEVLATDQDSCRDAGILIDYCTYLLRSSATLPRMRIVRIIITVTKASRKQFH
jgi:hypothetical protein